MSAAWVVTKLARMLGVMAKQSKRLRGSRSPSIHCAKPRAKPGQMISPGSSGFAAAQYISSKAKLEGKALLSVMITNELYIKRKGQNISSKTSRLL